MPLYFERPYGASSDTSELEYISALMQTEKLFLRQDGSITARDIYYYLKSRHGIKVSQERIQKEILMELAGSYSGAEKHELHLMEIEESRRRLSMDATSRAAAAAAAAAGGEGGNLSPNGGRISVAGGRSSDSNEEFFEAVSSPSKEQQHMNNRFSTASIPEGGSADFVTQQPPAADNNNNNDDGGGGGSGLFNRLSKTKLPKMSLRLQVLRWSTHISPDDFLKYRNYKESVKKSMKQSQDDLLPMTITTTTEAAEHPGNEEMKMDLCQIVTLLLIPKLRQSRVDYDTAQEEKRGRSTTNDNLNQQQPPSAEGVGKDDVTDDDDVDLVDFVLRIILRETDLSYGQEITTKVIRQMYTTLEESSIPPKGRIEIMMETARKTCGTGTPKLDKETFLRLLTDDIDAYNTNLDDTRPSAVEEVNAIGKATSTNDFDANANKLRRIYTVSNIDSNADTYRSKTWAILSWYVIVVVLFSYCFKGPFPVYQWEEVGCNEEENANVTAITGEVIGCSIGIAILKWFEVFVTLSVVGLPFMYLASQGNTIYLDRDHGRNKELALITLAFVSTALYIFMPWFYNVDYGIFDADPTTNVTEAPAAPIVDDDYYYWVDFEEQYNISGKLQENENFFYTDPLGQLLLRDRRYIDWVLWHASALEDANAADTNATDTTNTTDDTTNMTDTTNTTETTTASGNNRAGLGPLSLFLGTWLMLVQLGQIFRVCCLRDRSCRTGKYPPLIRSAIEMKQAAIYKIDKLVKNALKCHIMKQTRTRPAIKNQKSSCKQPTPCGISTATVRYNRTTMQKEKAGGLLWIWKKSRDRSLYYEEGIWIWPRLVASNLAQWLTVFATLVGPLFFVYYLATQQEMFPGYVTNRQLLISTLVGFCPAFAAVFSTSLIYIPSAISRMLQYRSGVIQTLHDRRFLQKRLAMDTSNMLFGAAFWLCLTSGFFFFLNGFIITFFCVHPFFQPIMLIIVSNLIGVVVTLTIKQIFMLVIRSRWSRGYYRSNPALVNISNAVQEVWNLGLTTFTAFVRSFFFFIIFLLHVGRIEQEVFAPGVGWFMDRIPLDGLPFAFARDLLSHDAHRHPLIERLGFIYLIKLRKGSDFGTPGGAAWRLLFTFALLPWLRKYRKSMGVVGASNEEERKALVNLSKDALVDNFMELKSKYAQMTDKMKSVGLPSLSGHPFKSYSDLDGMTVEDDNEEEEGNEVYRSNGSVLLEETEERQLEAREEKMKVQVQLKSLGGGEFKDFSFLENEYEA